MIKHMILLMIMAIMKAKLLQLQLQTITMLIIYTCGYNDPSTLMITISLTICYYIPYCFLYDKIIQ